MTLRRRDLLCAGGALGLFAIGVPPGAWAAAGSRAVAPAEPLAAWMRRRAGEAPRYCAGRVGTSGVELPERAHQIAHDPRNPRQAFVVARRPGEWLWRIDLARGRVQTAFAQDGQRSFEGHVLPWGTQLFTTESETEQGAGLLVRRDARSLIVETEHPTGGVGPHEALAWGEGGIAVANGGILTLPESGRERRNPGPLQSSLAWLAARGGAPRGLWLAPAAGLSLRHLAVAGDGALGVAMQAQDEPGAEAPERAPVLAILVSPLAKDWRIAEADRALRERMKGYAGSIAVHGDAFAVSCPRGDRVVIWSSAGRLLAECLVPGACGLVADANGWWVSSESGDLHHIAAQDFVLRRYLRRPGIAWDNHLA